MYMIACTKESLSSQMALKSEKSQKIERREVYMLHRIDIQRLSGKKGITSVLPSQPVIVASFSSNR